MFPTIRKFSEHRAFDQRVDNRVTQFNELMENGSISVTEHALARPLVLMCRGIVHDALADKPHGRTPEAIHASYDDRVAELLSQVSEKAEKELLTPVAAGTIRSIIESFRNVTHDALVSKYGGDLPMDTVDTDG